MMDDGAGGSFASRDASDVENKNYLRSHQVTFPAEDLGKIFRFYLRAINEIGVASSVI